MKSWHLMMTKIEWIESKFQNESLTFDISRFLSTFNKNHLFVIYLHVSAEFHHYWDDWDWASSPGWAQLTLNLLQFGLGWTSLVGSYHQRYLAVKENSWYLFEPLNLEFRDKENVFPQNILNTSRALILYIFTT